MGDNLDRHTSALLPRALFGFIRLGIHLRSFAALCRLLCYENIIAYLTLNVNSSFRRGVDILTLIEYNASTMRSFIKKRSRRKSGMYTRTHGPSKGNSKRRANKAARRVPIDKEVV